MLTIIGILFGIVILGIIAFVITTSLFMMNKMSATAYTVSGVIIYGVAGVCASIGFILGIYALLVSMVK